MEVVVRHLGKVAKANNKMDVDNLGLLFGQVLLWPDPNAPLDMKLIAGIHINFILSLLKIHCIEEAAKNVQVADALIRYNAKIFPAPNSLAVPV